MTTYSLGWNSSTQSYVGGDDINLVRVYQNSNNWSLHGGVNYQTQLMQGRYTTTGSGSSATLTLIAEDESTYGTVATGGHTAGNGSWELTLAAIPPSRIDTKMGNAYYEEDLTTGIKKYFAEAFKFQDGDVTFEKDESGNVTATLSDAYASTLAVDLTNIVNTSITTATLTADNATVNQTLTALGINVTSLLSAKGVDVGEDGLTIVDAQGHKHKLHLGN